MLFIFTKVKKNRNRLHKIEEIDIKVECGGKKKLPAISSENKDRERGKKQRQREGWLQFHTGSWGQICSGFLKRNYL